MLSVLLSASLASTSAFVSGWASAPPLTAPLRSRVAVAAVAEPVESASKEYMDSAKDEEEEAFNEAAAAAAAEARSDEALSALRARGEAAAAALRAADSPAVKAVLEARGESSKAAGKLAKALRKMSGTMSLVGEGEEIDAISLGGFDLNDPHYLSSQFRVGGCAAVCVRTDCMEGTLSDDALPVTVAEQETARGEFPSPVPIIARGAFVDELQLAAAKAAGAVGAVLPLALNGADKTASLCASASELGLEPIVRVSDAAQLEAALAMEAPIVAFGDCTLAEAAALREAMPAGKKGPVSVADLPFFDVRGAWMVRDAKFNAMIGGKALLELCARDRVPPTAICKAMNSKGSVKYGLGMQKGRLEGAKEDLGTIAM